jgi:hypothetical protein
MSKYTGCTIKIPESGTIFDRSIGGALSKLDRHLREKYNSSINRLIAEDHRRGGRRRPAGTNGGGGNGFDISRRIFRRAKR